jgi:hypothetical protein
MTNRFDLEQQILNCWNIVEDLDFLIDDNSDDKTMNIVFGLKELYQRKFDKLFTTFEQCLKNREI